MGIFAHSSFDFGKHSCYSGPQPPSLELTWSLNSQSFSDIALLHQPCVNASFVEKIPEACRWGENTCLVKTWGTGTLLVKQPTVPEQTLNPAIEANLRKNCNRWPRQRLTVAHCGTPVLLPFGCRSLPWHEDLPSYFVTIWDSFGRPHPQHEDEHGLSCFTRTEALEMLIAYAKHVLKNANEGGSPSKVDFELLVETLVLVAVDDKVDACENRGTGQKRGAGNQRFTQLHRTADDTLSEEMGYVEEIVFGGVLSGTIEMDSNGILLGSGIAMSNCALVVPDVLPELAGAVGSQDLEDQINDLVIKFLRSPRLWSLLHASPSLPGEASGTSLSADATKDSDVFVQSRLQMVLPAVTQTEDLCNSTVKMLRKLAGLPEDCCQLQLDLHNVTSIQIPVPKSPSRANCSSLPSSPRRSPLGFSSREDVFFGFDSASLTATRPFSCTRSSGTQPGSAGWRASPPTSSMQLCSQTPSSYWLVEFNLMLYRWGFWLQVDNQKADAIDNQMLQLEPGTMVDIHLELPPESLRLPWHPHQFLVTLVPSIAAPWNLKSLMEAALLVERLPGDIARKNSPSLDIQLAVPESLESPVPPIGLELRVYAVELGSLEDRNGGCVALGRPLKCRIGSSPGPLEVLTSLSTNLVQWKLIACGTLRHVCKGDPSNFWADVQNNFLEPNEIVFCHSADEFALRNAIAHHGAYDITDTEREESGQLPRPPEALEIYNKDMAPTEGQSQLLCVVSSGVPVVSIKTEKGIHSYRIECIRKVALGSGARPNAAPRSFVFLTTQVPVGTPTNTNLHLKIANLLPGRYAFRAQARFWSSTTFGPFSPMPPMDCLLPDHAEQVQRLHEVSEIVGEGRQVGNIEKLKSAMKAAIDTGVESDNRILVEANKLLQRLESDLQGQSLRRWLRAEEALSKVRVQIRLQYRPTLEKALQEAADAGVDMKSPEMVAAYSLFYDLQHTETVYRKQAQARSQKCSGAKKMLRQAAKPPRIRATIEQALEYAEKVGVPAESELVREARTALRAAIVSEEVVYRRQFRRRIEEHKVADDEKKSNFRERQKSRESEKNPQQFLRRGSALRRQKTGPLDQLFDAAQRGQVDRVEKLLASRVDLTETGANGMTAVSFAAQNAHVEVVLVLLNAKAAPDQLDDMGGTALMHCATHDEGHRVLSVLCEMGADVNLRNAYGKTALHIAASGQKFRVVRALIAHKADPEAQDIDGETPITVASAAPSGVARSLVMECLEGARSRG